MLALPSLCLLLPFLVAPVLLVIHDSLQGDAGLSTGRYMAILGSPYYRLAFWRTIALGLGVATLSVVLALPLAYWMVRHSRWRGPLLLALAAPLLVNVLARLYGWQVLLAESGPINQLLRLVVPGAQPVLFLGTPLGVVIVMLHAMLPYAAIAVFNSAQAIEPAVLDAASTLATPWRGFWTVVVPLSAPGLMTGFSLVFSLSAASFIIPAVIGGGKLNTFPTLVYSEMMALNTSGGAALAVCLLVVLVPFGWLARATDMAPARGR